MGKVRRLMQMVGTGAAILTAQGVYAATGDDVAQSGDQRRTFEAADGATIHYRYWPASSTPEAAVQIVHGAAEHSGRYDQFADFLTEHGYAVYATDHRGHGHTRVRSGELGDAGPDAWNSFVTDEAQLSQSVREAHPDADLVMLGHSMGSFIAQDYITRYPERLDGLILSGTAYGPAPPEAFLEQLDAATEKAPLAPSVVWASLFKDFNKPFSGQPGFDWLSRDPQVVEDYEQDPLAGFAFSNALVRDFFRGMAELRDPAREARIPQALPILVIQGERDPVGGNLEKTKALLARYEELGLTNVSHHFYPGARHEVLNETNRDEVQNDVLTWLDKVTQ